MKARLLSAVFVALVVFAGACRAKQEPDPARGAPSAPASKEGMTVATDAAPAAAAEPACPPPDAKKLEKFVCKSPILDAPIPPLVDPKGSLAPFYERVIGLARGRGDRHVRIAMYGDSNLTADAESGRLRRQLSARFGDAGHGFVALAQPWGWYSHNDVHHDGTWKHPGFKQMAASDQRNYDGHYGFANIASECGVPACAAWVSTDPAPGAPIGWTASSFDLYYMKRPDGGRFDVALDGAVVKSIDSKAEKVEAGFERFETTDAHHELRVIIKGYGPVRLYGVVLERKVPGIQVDSLGTGSMNLELLKIVQNETRRQQLEHRGYDLVLVQLGTNVWGSDSENKKNSKFFLDQLRAALPAVPVLFFSPPDEREENAPDATHSDPRIKALTKTFRAVAEEYDAAFWDYRGAMGGDDSIFTFIKKGLVQPDKVHLTKQGHELMADRFLCALWDGLAAYAEAHPTAGCSAR